MVEIPNNTYRVDDDPRVEKLVSHAVDALKQNWCETYTVYAVSYYEQLGIRSESSYNEIENIALAAGRHFKDAGYHVGVCRYVTGYFNFMRISKKPICEGYDVRPL